MSTQPLAASIAIDAQNPWPGLSAFDEAAERFFNGRDAESAELLRLVGQAPLTVLFGKSGLGKTSLVQAGLFPRLRQQNVLPVYVRLDVRERSAPLIEQAATALQAEIGKHGVDATASNASENLWDPATGRHRSDPLSGFKFVPSIAFSPDGKTVATGSAEELLSQSLRLWDVASGRALGAPLQLGPPVQGSGGVIVIMATPHIAFSPDGRTPRL